MADTYKNILVAVDGSPQSRFAFIEAVKITKRNVGNLSVVAVTDMSNLWGESHGYVLGDILSEQEKEARATVDILVETYGGGLKIKKIFESGSPKSVIARELPEKFHFDLIVIGATGKGAVQRALLGSTTNFVVTHAPCNVLVVRELDSEE